MAFAGICNQVALRSVVVAALGSVALSNASADIIQSKWNSVRAINYYAPGQTFTAVDAQISTISFYIQDFNPTNYPDDRSLTVSLYSGGTGSGSAIKTVTNSNIAGGYDGFLDFDFSGVSLAVNGVYSAMLSGSTDRWGVSWFVNGDPYADGAAIFNGVVRGPFDLAFRVLAATNPVPEPGGLALVGLGMAGVVLSRRRRAA